MKDLLVLLGIMCDTRLQYPVFIIFLFILYKSIIYKLVYYIISWIVFLGTHYTLSQKTWHLSLGKHNNCTSNDKHSVGRHYSRAVNAYYMKVQNISAKRFFVRTNIIIIIIINFLYRAIFLWICVLKNALFFLYKSGFFF